MLGYRATPQSAATTARLWKQKTFCSNCRVHCYKPEMREAIRTVMRYSAPRMLYIHPIAAIRHVVTSRAEKRRLKKEEKSSRRPH